MRKIIKRIERKLFDLLRFDTLGYDYSKPEEDDPDKLRLILLDDYFKNQPGFFRVYFIKVYLFTKKSVRFVLRRALRVVRRR
jgi:hypothetical protein